MELLDIYQSFSDLTRLRILHLLAQTPLCVCHFQEILNEPQVKISKHLGYLRERGLVTTAREKNWVIYSLPEQPNALLAANLKCLCESVRRDAVFKRDLQALAAVRARRDEPSVVAACC